MSIDDERQRAGKRFPSTARVALFVSACAAAVIALGLFAYQSLASLSELTDFAAEVQQGRLDLAQVLETLVKMGGGLRQYRANGDPAVFDDARTAARALTGQLDTLDADLSPDRVQRPLLEQLRDLARRRTLQSQDVIDRALRADAGGLDALLAGTEGTRIIDACRALVEHMQARQMQQLEQHQQAAARARTTAEAAIGITTTLATFLLVLVALITMRHGVRLRRAQEELATTLRAIGDAVISTDALGRIRFMNAVAEQLTGWSTAKAEGLPLDQVFKIQNETTGETVQSPVSHVLLERHIVGLANHTVLLGRDGTLRPIEDSGAPIYDDEGQIVGVVLVFRDATAERAAQKALRASEAALRDANITLEQKVIERTAQLEARETLIRTFYEHSSECHAVLTEDENGLFRYDEINPATLRLYGKSRADVIGRSTDEVLGPTASAELNTQLRKCLAANVPFHYERAHSDGIIEAIATPVPHEAQASRRIVVSARDATERRRLEQQLLQARKMEAVGQLTGGLAHDFNNLLSGISGSFELLQTRVAQGRLDDLNRFITAGQGAARRAAALTHRLLAFSRRQTLDAKPTDVNRLITDMVELIGRTVGPEITIEVVGAMGLWHPSVDANQLENALLNLCINARDAMPGGGKITIETANRWIDERTAQERELTAGQYISVCVSDTGCGMSTEVKARAFDPFFTTKPLGQGTGLGLSMIYGFARQSGGQVRIYSEPGQGAMICIYLPRSQGSEESAVPRSSGVMPVRSDRTGTVLVVDDEAVVRMLIIEVLQELGHAAIECVDGVEALKVLESPQHIDLMVTDVGLPNGINGRQLADAARKLRPALKVLFVTGYAENAALSHGHLERGFEVLTKPFAMDALGARVSALMAGSATAGSETAVSETPGSLVSP